MTDYSYYDALLKYCELRCGIYSKKKDTASEAVANHSYYEAMLNYLELRYNHNHDSKGRFCSGSGAGGNSAETLDKSAESGIIESGSEGMYRKSKEGKIEPMPKKQLRKIVKCFTAHGGRIQMDDETDKYLESKHSEGITYNSKTILLKQNPGRAAVFEELIHSAQYRDGKNDSSYVSRVKCEIEAQKKLLKNAKAYKLTDAEIYQTREALKGYEQELELYYRK